MSGGRRSVWIAILALSPLAYFGAARLEREVKHHPRVGQIDKDKAIALAREFAKSMGIDAATWNANPTTDRNSTVAKLLLRQNPPRFEGVAAPAVVVVRMRGSKTAWANVTLTPEGRVLGFGTNRPSRAGAPPDEATARSIAEKYLRAQVGTALELNAPVEKNLDREGWERDFAWEAPIPGLPEGKAKFHVTVAGTWVTGDSRSVELEPAAERQLRDTRTWKTVHNWLAGIYFVVLGIYAVVRYVRRSMEKEISHRRTLLIALSFAIAGELVILPYANINLEISGLDGQSRTAGLVAMHLVMLVILAIVGLFFGIPYGAGEGDLREAYPGKLTSTDAYLSGKVFSANVARSILAGIGFAGWLLLIQNVARWAMGAAPLGGPDNVLGGAAQGSPLARLVYDETPDILLISVYGLMLPLTFLKSKIRKTWAQWALLIPLAAIAASTGGATRNTWQNDLLLTGLFTAAVLTPFFFGDLLAALASVAAFDLVGALIRNSAVSERWHGIAYQQVLPVATVFLVVQLYCAWRGRVYDEVEVKPLYARNMAERQTLTAEIGAARMAQLRLLPEAAPRIAGLTIAGSCIPAREVGGDFFDYFALDAHRLGVFVAEGGNRELGSAMAIALAKGFLLYTVRLDLTPVEVLRRLRGALASVLRGDNTAMSVLYAVIDGRDGSVRYARAGNSPHLVVNGRPVAEEIVRDSGDVGEIRHGAVTLAPRDAIWLFTDGLSQQLQRRSRQKPEEFLAGLGAAGGATAEELHSEMLNRAFRRLTDAPPDDVTAVVVRREEAAAMAIGGIA